MKKNITQEQPETRIVWRLREQPTIESLIKLTETGLITKEEAREILLNKETKEERANQDLIEEIKFLQKAIARLEDKQAFIKVVREITSPVYIQRPWFNHYTTWGLNNIHDTRNIVQCSN